MNKWWAAVEGPCKKSSALYVILYAKLRGREKRFGLACVVGIRVLSWCEVLLWCWKATTMWTRAWAGWEPLVEECGGLHVRSSPAGALAARRTRTRVSTVLKYTCVWTDNIQLCFIWLAIFNKINFIQWKGMNWAQQLIFSDDFFSGLWARFSCSFHGCAQCLS